MTKTTTYNMLILMIKKALQVIPARLFINNNEKYCILSQFDP